MLYFYQSKRPNLIDYITLTILTFLNHSLYVYLHLLYTLHIEQVYISPKNVQ